MPKAQGPYAWARGLGRRTLQFTLVIAFVLVAVVVVIVSRLGDTPPVNAAIYPDPPGGMDALLEATLVLDDECITVEVDGLVYLPVFPASSVRLEHDTLLYAGRAYRSGETIALGGGEVSAPPPDARIPPGCPTEPDGFWLVAP